MEQNICVLEFGNREKAQGLILKILCNEWPLSVTALHKRLTQRHAHTISYQGTHKLVKKMIERDALEKEGKRYYKINLEWLDKINNFSSKTKKSYLNKTGKLEFPI